MEASLLLKELENTKRNLEEVRSRIRSTEQLIEDRQAQFESLQSISNEKAANLNTKLQSLEEAISITKLNHEEAVDELQHELTARSDAILKMEKELKDLQRKSATVKNDTCNPLMQDYLNLQNENQVLQDECTSLTNTIEEAEKMLNADVKHHEALKEKLSSSLDSLAQKKSELAEKHEHIDVLKEELLAVSMQKNCICPTISQKEDTPTAASLFSEVNDRRIDTQRTINSMKSNCIKMVEDHARIQKKLSQLQCENGNLKLIYSKSELTLEECKAPFINSLKAQAYLLKELSKIHEEKLNGQEASDSCTSTYQLFQDAIELAEAEVKSIEEKVSNWFLSEHMLSSSLIKVKREIETLQNTIEMLENDANRSKFTNSTLAEDEKHFQSNPQGRTGCLKSVNESGLEEFTTRFEGITLRRGSGRNSVEPVNKKPTARNVRFTENTISN